MFLVIQLVLVSIFIMKHACASETPDCSPTLPIPTDEYLPSMTPELTATGVEATPGATVQPTETPAPTITGMPGATSTPTPEETKTEVAGSSAVMPTGVPVSGKGQ